MPAGGLHPAMSRLRQGMRQRIDRALPAVFGPRLGKGAQFLAIARCLLLHELDDGLENGHERLGQQAGISLDKAFVNEREGRQVLEVEDVGVRVDDRPVGNQVAASFGERKRFGRGTAGCCTQGERRPHETATAEPARCVMLHGVSPKPLRRY